MGHAWDALFTNVHLATMADGYGEIRDAAIAVKDGRIAWLGHRNDAPHTAHAEHDGGGCWLTPGLIDCHTHIVHAGNRSDEFEARLNGATYEDIARAGGSVTSTASRFSFSSSAASASSALRASSASPRRSLRPLSLGPIA